MNDKQFFVVMMIGWAIFLAILGFVLFRTPRNPRIGKPSAAVAFLGMMSILGMLTQHVALWMILTLALMPAIGIGLALMASKHQTWMVGNHEQE